MTDTIIGVYEDYTHANRSREELLERGFPASDVQLGSQQDTIAEGAAVDRSESSGGSGFGNFFRSLFGSGGRNEDAEVYSEALRHGSYLVTVTARDEAHCEEAIEVLSHNGAIDINDRAAHWKAESSAAMATDAAALAPAAGTGTLPSDVGMTGTPARATAALAEDKAIPVIQEELAIGKREIDRGGVRVFRRVEEVPVHESVQLRQEEVVVERRPVDREATPEQLAAAFTEGTLEVRERAEEAVVAKTARVVEEVVIGKEVHEDTHAIDETLRRTEVEVQSLPPERAGIAADAGVMPLADEDSRFREHWQSHYASAGGSYDEYAPAYRYGSTLAGDPVFGQAGGEWYSIEDRVRPDWERRHPGSTWERFKDAIRHGWESMTGRR
ncbi:YsnF/AvaK domain-containing protein [Derxia gummosa]|uniref:YsnF/AvaK domain-containing protein n=1 Tax=Derxia gummosa DSM 723 TaxID=1121388 RepID=A0A8B6X3F8_9BURK|nr:YsnF/AvaK domain-containing protein [Derxia gummosa]